MRDCSVPDCDLPHFVKGFCKKHYLRVYRSGTPDRKRGGEPLPSFMRRVLKCADGCWLWRGSKGDRYGTIWIPALGKTVLVHRHSYRLHHGEIPEGLLVMHKCDVPLCVNPDHLMVGTPKDNMQDMIAKGRQSFIGPRGEKSSLSKLTDESVREIRASAASNEELAGKYGVHPRTIYDIRRRHTWRHIE